MANTMTVCLMNSPNYFYIVKQYKLLTLNLANSFAYANIVNGRKLCETFLRRNYTGGKRLKDGGERKKRGWRGG